MIFPGVKRLAVFNKDLNTSWIDMQSTLVPTHPNWPQSSIYGPGFAGECESGGSDRRAARFKVPKWI